MSGYADRDQTLSFVTRFAPSPTGPLHLGHAFSALTAYEAAKSASGCFLLRIEDIDHARCRPEFEEAIYDDLRWLEVQWEAPVRRQSEHMVDYEAALDRLRAMGLLYRCFRTRKEVAEAAVAAPHGPEQAYRGAPLPLDEEAARLADGKPFAWRLSLEAARTRLGDRYNTLNYFDEGEGLKAALPNLAGDVVLARKDVGVAYHLASVVDDALQGVTHVIRGEDLKDAVHVQRLLQALLGLPTPVYRHHRLITDPSGKRFAKRDRDGQLIELRARGVSRAEVRAMVGLA